MLDTRLIWREAVGKVMKGRGTKYIVLLLIIDFLGMIAAPDFGRTTAHESGVELAGRQRVGNYEVATVKAKDKGELDRWLTENKFAKLPETAAKAADDYAKEGWVFLISRLEKTPGRSLAPHPLRVRFQAKEPVYPMRLTAMGGGETEVHLYVAGKERFAHPLLETVLADEFSNKEVYSRLAGSTDIKALEGKDTHVAFAQPDLLRTVPAGMWITALKGTLSPGQMGQDLVLRGAGAEGAGYRRVVYTVDRAFGLAIFWMMLIFTAVSPFWAGCCRQMRQVNLCYAAFPGMVWLGGMVFFFTLPMIGNVVTIQGHPSIQRARWNNALRSICIDVAEHKKSVQAAGNTAVQAAEHTAVQAAELRARILKEVVNPFNQEKMREEASPGNFMVKTDGEGRTELWQYDEYGYPTRRMINKEEDEKAAQDAMLKKAAERSKAVPPQNRNQLPNQNKTTTETQRPR